MSSVYRIENEEGMGPLGRRGIELTHEIMYRHYRRRKSGAVRCSLNRTKNAATWTS